MGHGAECTFPQGHNRHIFLRGQSHFSWFFSRHEMLFLGRKFPFGRPKTNFRHFQKWKAKKKKRSSTIFKLYLVLFLLPFSFSTFHISIFLLSSQYSQYLPLFPFFLVSFFPIHQQKFPGQKSLGGHSSPFPQPVMPLPSPPKDLAKNQDNRAKT